jgi:uncharacterized protein YceK
MKNIIFIFVLLLLTGCSNWRHQNITYLKCKKLNEIHVHLYHHDSCEWSCLHLDEQYVILVDTFKVKYKVNKKGEVTKVKLVI